MILQRDFANAVLVHNLDFVVPWRDDEALRSLVNDTAQSVKAFLERAFWVVIPARRVSTVSNVAATLSGRQGVEARPQLYSK